MVKPMNRYSVTKSMRENIRDYVHRCQHSKKILGNIRSPARAPFVGRDGRCITPPSWQFSV